MSVVKKNGVSQVDTCTMSLKGNSLAGSKSSQFACRWFTAVRKTAQSCNVSFQSVNLFADDLKY